jgi:hypothetical protein
MTTSPFAFRSVRSVLPARTRSALLGLFVALAQISCGNGSSETRDQDPLALQPENALDCCDGGAGAARDASAALDAGGASGTRGKFVGNITTTGAVRSDFASLWDQITPENEGKWGSVEPVRNQMNWAPLDRIYAYARQHGRISHTNAFPLPAGRAQPSPEST